VPVPCRSKHLRNLGARQRPRAKGDQYGFPDFVVLAEKRIEYRVEIKKQLTRFHKTHPADVFAGVQARIYFLQVARHAACHGEDIQ